MCVKKETKEVHAHKPIRQIQEHVFFTLYTLSVQQAVIRHVFVLLPLMHCKISDTINVHDLVKTHIP